MVASSTATNWATQRTGIARAGMEVFPPKRLMMETYPWLLKYATGKVSFGGNNT
jgi:hypothetical protein